MNPEEKAVTPVPVNPSPKARFMATKAYVEAHRSLMQRPDVERGLDYGLLEYQRQICEQRGDVNSAAANHFRILGALEFIQVLKTLGESPRHPTVSVVGNLDHKA